MTLLPISLGSGSAKPLSTSDSHTLPDLSTALKKHKMTADYKNKYFDLNIYLLVILLDALSSSIFLFDD